MSQQFTIPSLDDELLPEPIFFDTPTLDDFADLPEPDFDPNVVINPNLNPTIGINDLDDSDVVVEPPAPVLEPLEPDIPLPDPEDNLTPAETNDLEKEITLEISKENECK